MSVIILCGGKGTRMWPSTKEIPKPMAEIGGKPLLWHLMKMYAHHGFTDFILCLGYLSEQILNYFVNNEEGWNIQFVFTGLDVDKSQRLLAVKDHIKTETFLVSYGDDLSNVNVKELVNFHNSHDKLVTLTSVPLYSQFGVLDMEGHEVQSFREKPRIEEYWINGGFFVFNKDIFNYLHLGELEDEVFKKLAEDKQIAAHKFDGFWKGMNTSKDCQEFNKLFDSGSAPWVCWDQ